MTLARTWLRRLAALLVGLGAGLTLAELGARLLGPIPGEELYYGGMAPPPEGLFQWSETLGTEPTPGFSGVRAALDADVPLRINSLGLRGPEPAAHGERWLTVGDSFVFGAQVREEDTFQAHLAAGLGVEVLNGGVDGYSTLQAARRYVELDEEIDASTVVAVYFLGNDLHDNQQAASVLEAAAAGPAAKKPMKLQRSPMTFLARNSYVAAYVHVAYRRRAHLAMAEEGHMNMREQVALWSYEGKPRLDTLLEATDAALVELRDAAAARGDDLLVAVVPPAWFVDEAMLHRLLDDYGIPKTTSDAPRTAVMALLAERGIPKCDLSPGLQAAFDAGEQPYLRFDGHWSAAGHRVAAAEIARCVRREQHERRLVADAPASGGDRGDRDADRPRPRRPSGEARVPGSGGRAERPALRTP